MDTNFIKNMLHELTTDWKAVFGDRYPTPDFRSVIAANSFEAIRLAAQDVLCVWESTDGEVDWEPAELFAEMISEYSADLAARSFNSNLSGHSLISCGRRAISSSSQVVSSSSH